MNYKKHYDLLIDKAKKRIEKLPYYESHHIIPKSEGGLDDSSNIVKLTAREHFIAHWLLYRIDPTISSRAFSFWRMCRGRGTTPKKHWIIISSRCYEEARLAHSKAISKALKGVKKSPEHAAKVGLAVRGKKRTEEQKQKLRKPHKISEDGKKVLRELQLRRVDLNKRKVKMLDKFSLKELMTFNSMKEAADYVGVANSNICTAIKNKKTSGGYRWDYLN